jgi:hypothetical protein
VERLKAEYCDVLATFKLPDAEGCGDTHLVEDAGSMSKIEWRKAQLDALARNKELLVIDVSQARILYRLAIKRSLNRWIAHASQGTQGPGARLDECGRNRLWLWLDPVGRRRMDGPTDAGSARARSDGGWPCGLRSAACAGC